MLTVSDIRNRENRPFVLAYGGGLNSIAVAILLRNLDLRPTAITMADTGGEKPGTYEYLVEHVGPWLARYEFPAITMVRLHKPVAGDKTLEDQCVRLGTLPSRAYGQGTCALRWKKEPQDRYLENRWPERCDTIRRIRAALAPPNPHKKSPSVEVKTGRLGFTTAQDAREALRAAQIYKALGYDGGEEQRAGIGDDGYSLLWFPLIEADLDRDACASLVRAEGLPLPPKSACFYCPSSTKAEVLDLAKKHPDLYKRAVFMERAAAQSGKSHSIEGLGRHWSWERLVQISTEERAQLPERPVESCLMCADDDDTPTATEVRP